MTATLIPELSTAITHLRDTLGDPVYESLAVEGENMTHRRHGEVRIRPDRPGPNQPQTDQMSFSQSRGVVGQPALDTQLP